MSNDDILMYVTRLNIVEGYVNFVDDNAIFEMLGSSFFNDTLDNSDYFNCIDEENCINKVELIEEQDLNPNAYFDCINENLESSNVVDNDIHMDDIDINKNNVDIVNIINKDNMRVNKNYVVPIFLLGSIALNFYPNVL